MKLELTATLIYDADDSLLGETDAEAIADVHLAFAEEILREEIGLGAQVDYSIRPA